MKITAIRVSRTFHLGNSNFEKVEISSDLDNEDEHDQSIDFLRNEIECNHIKAHAELYEKSKEPLIVSKVKERGVDKMIPDNGIIVKYQKAVLDENERMVNQLETVYSKEHLKKPNL